VTRRQPWTGRPSVTDVGRVWRPHPNSATNPVGKKTRVNPNFATCQGYSAAVNRSAPTHCLSLAPAIPQLETGLGGQTRLIVVSAGSTSGWQEGGRGDVEEAGERDHLLLGKGPGTVEDGGNGGL
jgi:hypothetical protein